MANEWITDVMFSGVIESQEKDDEDLEETLDEMSDEIEKVFQKYNIEYRYYELMMIDSNRYSIGKCEECGNFMVNRDKNPAGIEEYLECYFECVYDGGESNNQLLCENCLPLEHRWSSKSKS